MNRLVILALLAGLLGAADVTVPAGVAVAVAEPADQSRYVLYPGDLLHVEVFGQSDLACTLRVTADGVLTFPLVGSVPGVVGMSVADLAAELVRRYEDGYLIHARVAATVQEFAPRSAYVMGSVRTPGVVPLSPFGRTTATQAIVRAGGFLPEGNRAGTLVVRDAPSAPGGKITLVVPLVDSVEQLMIDVPLQPDDLVVVPQLDRVSVIGNVRTPGAVSLPGQGPLTVTRAIALVGGFEKFARSDRVQLIRPGAPTVVIDVAGLLAGTTHGEDPALRPGDTLFIPESRF